VISKVAVLVPKVISEAKLIGRSSDNPGFRTNGKTVLFENSPASAPVKTIAVIVMGSSVGPPSLVRLRYFVRVEVSTGVTPRSSGCVCSERDPFCFAYISMEAEVGVNGFEPDAGSVVELKATASPLLFIGSKKREVKPTGLPHR